VTQGLCPFWAHDFGQLPPKGCGVLSIRVLAAPVRARAVFASVFTEGLLSYPCSFSFKLRNEDVFGWGPFVGQRG
jgi:hypothetical protein